MKLVSLAEKLLKTMVNEYVVNEEEVFVFDFFTDKFPSETESFLNKALYLLEEDNFVKISPGDDKAYSTTLLPYGIKNCQEKTLLKKGYTAVKEIRSLLP